MARTGFDKVAIAGVYVVAIIEAAQEALANAPAVKLRFPMLDIAGGFWSYVPLILLTVSTVLWVLERVLPNGASAEAHPSTVALAKTVTEATDRLLASRPKPPDPTAPKAYVPEAFVKRYLAAVGSRRTELQIDAMLRPHVGQWMRLSGEVAHVSQSHDSIRMTLRAPEGETRESYFVKFHKSWSTHLANVEAGEVVTVTAQIVDSGYAIELLNGELV